ncbi:MAG TPA: hypothetical protein VN905_13015 [Candidatus Binatia bacterium]|nr:hypothetical protein [Candidatus Binatia bacterium]
MSKPFAVVLVVLLVALSPGIGRADAAAKAAVAAAFQKMAQAKSYRMTMTSASGEMTQDYVAPNRRHISGRQMEMITIGDDSWMKVDGKWQHVPKMPMGAMSAPQSIGSAPKAPETDVTLVGNQECQGQPAQVYQFSTSSASGTSEKSKLWVGSSGYPCRMQMGSSGASMQWSQWGAPLTIDAPM